MDEVNKLLQQILDVQNGMREDMAGMKENQNGMREEMAGMKENQNGMREEMAGMKEDQNGMREEMAGMKEDQNGMREEIMALSVGQARLERRIEAMDSMLKMSISTQSVMKGELLLKIGEVDERLGTMILGLDKKLTKRIDGLGMQLAYLDDDAPTREEFEALERRVEVVEGIDRVKM